jgi:hypothetical protein
MLRMHGQLAGSHSFAQSPSGASFSFSLAFALALALWDAPSYGGPSASFAFPFRAFLAIAVLLRLP